MEKLNYLVSMCKCGVYVSVNEHKDNYDTVEGYLYCHEASEIDQDVLAEMIKRNTVVKVQVYPHTPVGCYFFYHYDVDKALEIAIETIREVMA